MAHTVSTPCSSERDAISLQGVRVHNLKNLSLEIPLHKVVVLTGVSGSGKSSLIFDTLYAEAQRRYIETFSPYARQFFVRLEKPDADSIEHLPPAVILRQNVVETNSASSIATATSLHDKLALLFARMGIIICPGCGQVIERETPETAFCFILDSLAGCRIQIAWPLKWDSHSETLSQLKREGFHRIIVQNSTLDLVRTPLEDSLWESWNEDEAIWVLVDRLKVDPQRGSRLRESLELAFRTGQERVVILHDAPDADSLEQSPTRQIDNRQWNVARFGARLECLNCDLRFHPPEYRLFRYQSSLGACPTCRGSGIVTASENQNQKRNSTKNELQDTAELCPACQGKRLQPQSLAVHVLDENLYEVSQKTIDQAESFIQNILHFQPAHADRSATGIALELQRGLQMLQKIGLGYLSLDRKMPSLSSGEAQRVLLAASMDQPLVNSLYLFDEPSTGLHSSEKAAIIQAIRTIQQQGNSVILVEHDPQFLEDADLIIELGPGAGQEGGEVIYQGDYQTLLNTKDSPTGSFLALQHSSQFQSEAKNNILSVSQVKQHFSSWISISGCQTHHLKDIAVRFPLGALTIITGVSGSGKSSFLEETLYSAVRETISQRPRCPGVLYDQLQIEGQIDQVVLLDRRPIGSSSRSNLVTYLKAFDEIRRLFAETSDAKSQGLSKTDFSFNSAKGGRCRACRGLGVTRIDMQFLPDVSIPCEECQGSRYRDDILEIKYRQHHIADVLALTVREAFQLFRKEHSLQRKLKTLLDTGLDYLQIGQSLETLSGGEAQRLKLAAQLVKGTKSRVLFLFDEPSTGLHPVNVEKLLELFEMLVSTGHTLMLIEHNQQVIQAADYLVELGPGAGPNGGDVLFQGIPSEKSS